jgi:hypothetical protein
VKPARHVFRWDLDKTYLRTEFDSVSDLVKSAFETAMDKQAVPGAPALLRALRQHPGHRVCIVSGSPRQMRSVLTAKLALDGVEADEFVLKDNLRNVLRGRFRAMRAQIPYKLPVLLESRAKLVGAPPETLFGDDAESDAVIYSLYADLLDGRVTPDELPRIMQASRAYDDQIEHTLALARRIETAPGSVKRILIHLDLRSPPELFSPFGRRLVPIYNYFQAALVLYADGMLTARQVVFVALEMLEKKEYEISTLANSLQNLIMRGRLEREVAERLALECSEAATEGGFSDRAVDVPPFDDIAWAFATRLRGLGNQPPLESPVDVPRIDYVQLADTNEHRRRHRRRKLGTTS